MIEQIISIIAAILMSIIYALSGYYKNNPDTKFDTDKFITTIIVGIVVGIIMTINNTVITMENFNTILLSYGFLIVIIENIYKTIKRRILNAPAKGMFIEKP